MVQHWTLPKWQKECGFIILLELNYILGQRIGSKLVLHYRHIYPFWETMETFRFHFIIMKKCHRESHKKKKPLKIHHKVGLIKTDT